MSNMDGMVRYDYAWKTPGWSVQNPSFSQVNPDGYVDPGLPSDISKAKLLASETIFSIASPCSAKA